MSVTSSPLAATEESFIRLTRTHLLVRGHSVHPWLQDRSYGLDELREILMTRGTPYAVRDQVWRHTIAAARRSKDWMLGALGLAMPMLRSAARMARRGLDPHSVADVEAEALAAAMHQIRTIRLEYARIAYYLSCRVRRAALGARKRALAAPDLLTHPTDLPDSGSEPDTAGSCDEVLFAAAREGIISEADAELIARTRLEAVPLATIAAELGVAYKTLAKRRRRAETCLAAGLRPSHEHRRADEPAAAGSPASTVNVHAMRASASQTESIPRLPLAS
ncbi:sigma-70 family RNA polymerase sigma factor [Nocardiopsis dassonvillei]|uniref:sigma-70 family RNA polymerase sigma factor n=1 Tax=Nocardiopsis dassonvillei TaxID=2014 RepID=UPI00366DC9AD